MAGGCCHAGPTGSPPSAGSEWDTGTRAAKHSPGREGRRGPAGTEGAKNPRQSTSQVHINKKSSITFKNTINQVNHNMKDGTNMFQHLSARPRPADGTSHLLFVIVAVVVDAAGEAVAGHHPLLLH